MFVFLPVRLHGTTGFHWTDFYEIGVLVFVDKLSKIQKSY
jgi:hypothetical protein